MLFVGVDVGTTNCKAVALDEHGEMPARAGVPMPPHDHPDALSWLDGFRKAFCALLEQVEGGPLEIVCSIAAQGGSFVPVDAGFAPVQHGYCWTADARADTVDDMARVLGPEQCYRQCGFLPSAWLAGGKMREVAAASERDRQWRYMAAVPEFIHAQCGGGFLTDITNAQLTGLYDFPARRWDGRMLRWSGLERSDLAEVVADLRLLFDCPLERIAPGRAGRVRFATSSHDQYAAMLGAGLKPDGRTMMATGTAWVMSGKSSSPAYDFENHLTHPGRDFATDSYGLFIGLGQVGRTFDGILSDLGMDLAGLSRCEDDLVGIGPPSGYVAIDPETRTVSEDDTPVREPLRAVRRYMEYTAARARYLLEQAGGPAGAGKLVMTGGATGSLVWPQIVADVCGVEIEVVRLPELTAYGAAMAAAIAAGQWPGDRHKWPAQVTVTHRKPEPGSPYGPWYEGCQREWLAESPPAL